jgi:branched-chain amino acid transport system ATP-binding protein
MLEVRDLSVSYGKIRAVHGISLDVAEGEVVALIGANGAGKSSTMHAICGIEKPSGGTIRFQGDDITGRPAHEVIRRGIVQVPEGRLIFAGMTIEENLRLGALNAAGSGSEQETVLDLFPPLRERLDERGSALSGGEAQMLALARGLMARPKLLMLDEPSLGLAPVAVREVFALIARLREFGVTILLVEQNVRQALTVADRAYVLEGGRIILDGDARDLVVDEHLMRAYMGLTPEGDRA